MPENLCWGWWLLLGLPHYDKNMMITPHSRVICSQLQADISRPILELGCQKSEAWDVWARALEYAVYGRDSRQWPAISRRYTQPGVT